MQSDLVCIHTNPHGILAPLVVQSSFAPPSEPLCRLWLAPLVQTTHLSKSDFESVTITHPFHPLFGRTFKLLKVKKVNGIRLYSVETKEGVITIQENWTDRDPAFNPKASKITLFLLPSTLIELVELLESIKD